MLTLIILAVIVVVVWLVANISVGLCRVINGVCEWAIHEGEKARQRKQ